MARWGQPTNKAMAMATHHDTQLANKSKEANYEETRFGARWEQPVNGAMSTVTHHDAQQQRKQRSKTVKKWNLRQGEGKTGQWQWTPTMAYNQRTKTKKWNKIWSKVKKRRRDKVKIERKSGGKMTKLSIPVIGSNTYRKKSSILHFCHRSILLYLLYCNRNEKQLSIFVMSTIRYINIYHLVHFCHCAIFYIYFKGNQHKKKFSYLWFCHFITFWILTHIKSHYKKFIELA